DAEISVSLKMRNLKEQIDPLFKQTVGSLQRGGLFASKNAVASYCSNYSGAHSGPTVRIACDTASVRACAIILRSSGLRLKANTVGQRPAASLHSLQQYRLAG